MTPIRVVFAGLPPVLDSYLCGLFRSRDDIEKVCSYSGCEDLLSEIDVANTDIALVCLDEAQISNRGLEQILTRSGIKTIVIDERARNAFLFLGEASGVTIVDSILAIANRRLH